MYKKIISTLVIGTLLAGTLTGCGGSSDAGSSAKSSGKTELELFSTKPENKDTIQKLVDKYNESHDDVTVKVTAPPDAGTVLKTRMAKNDMPDMVYDVNKDKEETIYGVPFATNASGVIYNTEKFEELGLEVPKTWDEFIDTLQKIKDAGEQPLLMTYKDAWTANAPWNSIAADLAPESFADDRKAGKTTFVGTHEEITEKYLTLLDYAQDDFMGLSYDDGNKKFANGDAVMIINGNWAISQYRNANPDVKINMFALPSSNDESQNKVTSGVDVLLGVSKSSSNVDAAKDFVSFMMEKENVQTYIDEQFSFSALKDVEQSDEAVSGVQEDISNGKVANFEDHYYPSGFDMSALLTELSLNRANGMDDKENIEQFLKQCDEKYDVANVD